MENIDVGDSFVQAALGNVNLAFRTSCADNAHDDCIALLLMTSSSNKGVYLNHVIHKNINEWVEVLCVL